MIGQTIDLRELKVAKIMCKQSLLFSVRYFYKKRFKRKFIVDSYHKKICDALELVLKGQCKRLIINIGPRFGKTEIAVKNFIAHGLSLNPAAKFIHLSASAALAMENSEAARDIVKSEAYQQMFPNVRIKDTTDAKQKWYTTEGGGVYATGSTGQITGFGAGTVDSYDHEAAEAALAAEDAIMDEWLNDIIAKEGFGGAIIWDDPIKPDDADSDTKRLAANRKYLTTVKNRTNSRNTPIIIIGQRLHPQDLSGYVQDIEPDEWKVLSLQTLVVNAEGKLESICPRLYTVADLTKMEKSESEEMRIFFQRQLQQNPKSREGYMFPLDDLKLYNPETFDFSKIKIDYKAAFIDPADTGGDSNSMPIGFMIGDVVYIIDVVYNTHGTEVNESLIMDKLRRYDVQAVEFEGVGGWASFGTTIRSKLVKDGWRGEFRVIKPYTNKLTRILAQRSRVTKQFMFRSDWATCSDEYRKFMLNLTDYRQVQSINPNAHDDAPDSMAGLADFYKRKFPHLF